MGLLFMLITDFRLTALLFRLDAVLFRLTGELFSLTLNPHPNPNPRGSGLRFGVNIRVRVNSCPEGFECKNIEEYVSLSVVC